MNDTDMPEKIIPSSPDFQTEIAEKIAEIAPGVISDGKLDVQKLRELLNGDVETAQEKFGLFWPGKRAAQALAQVPTNATLVPAPDESEDWENTKNLFIEGDNLEVLKALQNSYRRKVKMIYIDPPYNTGKEFIYPDKFTEGLQGYLDYTGQKNEDGENIESQPETSGRKHSNWLSMMYPRLQLAKSLLTDDGVIFISIDDNEQSNLKKICDEVYGEENFIGIAPRKTRGSATTQNDNQLQKLNDYLLVYLKNIAKPSLNTKITGQKTYPYKDSLGDYYRVPLQDSGPNGFKVKRPNLYYSIFADNDNNISLESFDGSREIVPDMRSSKDGCWMWSKDKFKRDIKDIEIADNKVYIKHYYDPKEDQNRYQKEKLWLDEFQNAKGTKAVNSLFEESKGMFNNPKPVELISFLINIATRKDSIILDFFSGSGTTAHAVMQLNAEDGGSRRHIQVQLPEKTYTTKNGKKKPLKSSEAAFEAGYDTISELSIERIRRAGKTICEDSKVKITDRTTTLDTGFRVYKLAQSNFVQWDENEAKNDIQQSVLNFAANKKPEAAPAALLAEIMLQTRIPLSASIEKRELQNGGWIYVVDGGNLVAYVADEQITEAQAKEIADLAPAKLVILDSAFNGNDSLKINVANITKEKFIKEFRTI